MTLLLNPDGEKFGVKTCTEPLDRAHYVKDAATQSIKNQIDLGRKKIKPEGMRTQPPPPLLPTVLTLASVPLWQVHPSHPNRRLPLASTAAAQPQWGSPSVGPAPGSTSPQISVQPKQSPTRVTQESTKESERKRVQRRRRVVATVPVSTSTALESHVRTPAQGGDHNGSAENPGKNTQTLRDPLPPRRPTRVLGTEHAQ